MFIINLLLREEHPDEDWFQLVGLIHDMGKIMAFYGEPQVSLSTQSKELTTGPPELVQHFRL
jgi:hypothetical protein